MSAPQPQDRENRPALPNAPVVALLSNLLEAAARGEIQDIAAVVLDPRGRFAPAVCSRPESLPVLLVGLADLQGCLQEEGARVFGPPAPQLGDEDDEDDDEDDDAR